MKRNLKQAILLFIMFFLEIALFFRYEADLIKIIPFLGQSGESNYNELTITLIGSVAFSLLQLINFIIANIVLKIFDNEMFKFFSWCLRCSSKLINQNINHMLTFILSTECHWGPTQHAEKAKPANTAEGLLACAYAKESGLVITQDTLDIIKKCVDGILNVLEEDGYKLYSTHTYTTHATGMVLFALYKIYEVGLYEISDQNEEKIRKCLMHLLNTANQNGWQFENIQCDDIHRNRNISTLWVLRALNAWGYSGRQKFCDILENLTDNSNGIIGFSNGRERRSSVTALLFTLVNEIQNERTKNQILQNLDRKEILDFLIKSFREETEVEYIEITTPSHQTLPWTHLSLCMSFEALALMIDEMSVCQTLAFSSNLAKILKKVDKNHHYYIVHSMNFDHTDPYVYPTVYLLMALCKIQLANR